ncbi:hypothetical protein GN956_G18332 [Arapaima gigas]
MQQEQPPSAFTRPRSVWLRHNILNLTAHLFVLFSSSTTVSDKEQKTSLENICCQLLTNTRCNCWCFFYLE